MPCITVRCRDNRTFTFDPAKTALLVIDMQRDFLLDDAGAPNATGTVIPNVVGLLARMRGHGATIVHTRESYAPDLTDVTPHRASMNYVGRPGVRGRFLIRGEPGCDFVDELRPAEGDIVRDKPGFGAFFTTDLERVLRSRDVTHLVLCGVTTQCCVHSTLREAVDRGFWCLTIADCCGADRPEWHEAALSLIASEDHLFGWVADLADVPA